jgi:hypothetical protein
MAVNIAANAAGPSMRRVTMFPVTKGLPLITSMRRVYRWRISVGATCSFSRSITALLIAGESGPVGPRIFGAVSAAEGA